MIGNFLFGREQPKLRLRSIKLKSALNTPFGYYSVSECILDTQKYAYESPDRQMVPSSILGSREIVGDKVKPWGTPVLVF